MSKKIINVEENSTEKEETDNIDKLISVNIVETSSGTSTTKSKYSQFVQKVASDRRISEQSAETAISILIQQGGTSPKSSGAVNVSLSEGGDTITIKLEDLRNAAKSIEGSPTIRKLARTKPSTIYKIGKHFNIKGNLAKKLGFTENDAFWASDFQDNNPECPEHIRNKIGTHFKEFA